MRVGYVRMAVAAYPAEINRVGRTHLAYVVLADADRWVLASGAARHVVFSPSESVVRGDRHTVSAARTTRRVGNVNGAVRCHFNVAMNTTRACCRRVKDGHRGAEGLTTVVAARALSLGDYVLRAVVNRVWGSVRHSLRRRRWSRIGIVRSTTKRLMVWPLYDAAVSARQVRIPVII